MLMRLGRFRELAALLLLVMAGAAPSEENAANLAIKYEYYRDRNKVWNHTPCFLLKLPLARKWILGWEQELDVVSGASRRLGANRVGPFGDRETDAVSGASKIENRYSENPSITYSHKGTVATGSLYYSRENDYFSVSPAASLSWDFNERNTTLGVSHAQFFDDFRPAGAFAGQGGRKKVGSTAINLAQTLTPLTLVALTANYLKSDGYLGRPYNPPNDTGGALLTEVVPNRKQGGAISGQIVQGWLLGTSLGSANLDIRRYQDNWGLKSTTADIKLSQYLVEGMYIRLRGRFYNQTGSFFAKDFYTGREPYRVADIRYYPFSSFLGGAKISGPFPESWGGFLLLPDRWDIKYDHVFRNTAGDSHPTDQSVPLNVQRYQSFEPEEYYTESVILVGLVFDL